MSSSFNLDNLFPCQGEVVNFTDTSDETNIVTWEWDFGDNSKSNLQNPIHSYSNAGIYIITLTVNGDGGLVTSDNVLIEVQEIDTTVPTVNTVLMYFDRTLGCWNKLNPSPAVGYVLKNDNTGLVWDKR